ncbi:sigma-54-dependent transcriptional regulator [Thermodesulfobacteriota bacterium]
MTKNKTDKAKEKILGPSLSHLKDLVITLAEKGENILFVGPTGTGKELFARLYHAANERDKFAAINCAGVADNNLQSELFGHKKGSFTDAIEDRKGIIKTNEKNGVIFLDEIGDATPSLQAVLLRFLESGDYKPYGGDTIKNVEKFTELPIIAATSKFKEVREDLRNRFICLHIPPLHQRNYDTVPLVQAFLRESAIKNISENAYTLLFRHKWPGNVREMKKILSIAELLASHRKEDTLRTDDFSPLYSDDLFGFAHSPPDESKKKSIKSLEFHEQKFPASFFFSDQKSLEGPDLSYWENDFTLPLDARRDNAIISTLQLIRNKIEPLGPDSAMKQLSSFMFEHVTDKDYKDAFWEYHEKKGNKRGNLAKLFPGKMDNKSEKERSDRELKKVRGRAFFSWTSKSDC